METHLLPNGLFRYPFIMEFIYDIKSALMPADEALPQYIVRLQ